MYVAHEAIMEKFSKHILILSIVIFMGSLHYWIISEIQYRELLSPFGYKQAFQLQKKSDTRSNQESKASFVQFAKKEGIDIIAIYNRRENNEIGFVGQIPNSTTNQIDSNNVFRIGTKKPIPIIEYSKSDGLLDQGYFFIRKQEQLERIGVWVDDSDYKLYIAEKIEENGIDLFDDTSLLILASSIFFLVSISFLSIVYLSGSQNIIFSGNSIILVVGLVVKNLLMRVIKYGLLTSLLFFVFEVVYHAGRHSFPILTFITIPSLLYFLFLGFFGVALISTYVFINAMKHKFSVTNNLLRRLVIFVQSIIIVVILVSGREFLRINDEYHELKDTKDAFSLTDYAVLVSELPLSSFYEKWSVSPDNHINNPAKEALNQIEDKGGLALKVIMSEQMDRKFEPYGDIILINDVYFNTFPHYKGNKLSESVDPVDVNTLPESVVSFLDESFQVWGYDQNFDYTKFRYYSYSKDILTLPNRINIHTVHNYNNPLIIVVPKASHVYRADGLLGGSVEGTESYFLNLSEAEEVFAKIYPSYNPLVRYISDVLTDELIEIKKRLSSFRVYILIVLTIFTSLAIAYSKIDLVYARERYILSTLSAQSVFPNLIGMLLKILLTNLFWSIILIGYFEIYNQSLIESINYITAAFVMESFIVAALFIINSIRYVNTGAMADDLFI